MAKDAADDRLTDEAGVRVIVDDVDEVLAFFLHHPVELATFTGQVDTRNSPDRVPGEFVPLFE